MDKIFPTHIVAAAGMVLNDKNELLLVRDMRRNRYTVPGGQVEVGESLTEALVRELDEETGAVVRIDKLVCVSSSCSTHPGTNGYACVPTKVIFDFSCRYEGGELHTSDENSETLWVKMDKVLDYVTVPVIRERVLAYMEGGEGVCYLQYVTHPEFRLIGKRRI